MFLKFQGALLIVWHCQCRPFETIVLFILSLFWGSLRLYVRLARKPYNEVRFLFFFWWPLKFVFSLLYLCYECIRLHGWHVLGCLRLGDRISHLHVIEDCWDKSILCGVGWEMHCLERTLYWNSSSACLVYFPVLGINVLVWRWAYCVWLL